jgi:hypothetical protein
MILGREDVARDPAHIGAELRQRLDENRGLNRHVQAAHDAGAGERMLRRVLPAERHQAGHFLLRQPDLFASEFGQRQVLDFVGLTACTGRRRKRMNFFHNGRHIQSSHFLKSDSFEATSGVRLT